MVSCFGREMALTTHPVLRTLLVLSSTHQLGVFSYYCEWDQCQHDQYCCGDNLCCDYVYSMWYLWIGIIFAILLISACGGIFRYCFYTSPMINYTAVPVIINAEEGVLHRAEIEGTIAYSQYVTSNFGRNPPLPGNPKPAYTKMVEPSLSIQHSKDTSSFVNYL